MKKLNREIGIPGSIIIGLGSIIGTGIFVSLGMAIDLSGHGVIISILLAGSVALCNALNSAQLAANHPQSGGTYEYGYIYLSPRWGFTAGWMFLWAKSASAATAALGFSGYVTEWLNLDSEPIRISIAILAAGIITVVILGGLQKSHKTNVIIVCVSLCALFGLMLAGLPSVLETKKHVWINTIQHTTGSSVLHAAALMFVAFTGYGRIATLGEEVKNPKSTIPISIVLTLLFITLIYLGVAVASLSAGSPEHVSIAGKTKGVYLEQVAHLFQIPGLVPLINIGAMMAMLGVLLNLNLGLSRVWLAMGRRKDMPSCVGFVSKAGTAPYIAIAMTGLIVILFVLVGNIHVTWSFSAFAVLIYYSITNLTALKITDQDRLFPKWTAYIGLASCIFLAFWVDPLISVLGLVLIGAGCAWQSVAAILAKRRLKEPPSIQ
ncbi:MAG: amino acid permease [Kiritimatiellae bacterium]|nr:amino acid permease [Kiritimatiellia bacterium]